MKQGFFLIVLMLMFSFKTQAALTIEITEGVEAALPIAIVPFSWKGTPGQKAPQQLADIVAADLQRSGRFKPLDPSNMLSRPDNGDDVDFRDWRVFKMENLVVGRVTPNGSGGYMVRFQLFDVYRGEQLLAYNIPTTAADMRSTAHHISDLIYETLTGIPGAFATRIAYVTSTAGTGKNKKVQLHIADADGFNAQPIVTSTEPLMSPAWSPDGRRLAYVSFEKSKPSIWVQEVFTGKRDRLTAFKGINGAPAWSPDGRSLAMALSKDGNSEIYIMDIASRKLRRLTNHWAIDTEPAWSPDGKQLVFTSDRGGSAQIYRVAAGGGKPERLSWEGKYNARASYAPDGKSLTLITRVNGNYRIGVQDLDSGIMNVLSSGRLDESPSFAPNGSMIIYATRAGGKDVLAAVSTDGRVKQRLALKAGDVRDPVWSPYYKR